MRKLGIHIALLLGGFVAFISHEWGMAVHSAVGLGIGVVIGAHVVAHRKWIRAVARRRRAHPEARLGGFNALFATVFALCMATGFPLWFGGSGGAVAQIHNLTAIAFLLMIPGHALLNGRRIRSWFGVGRRRPAPAG